MGDTKVLFAFALTLIAGLSTGFGSLIALVSKSRSHKFLSLFLGVSAGVMIYVSFMEILPESISSLQDIYGAKLGMQFSISAFFFGMLISYFINKLIPDQNNSHRAYAEKRGGDSKKNYRIYRTGIISAVIIAMHNFPEGIATFMSAINSPRLALPVAFAIALHNIPEGITVAAPIYFATGDKKKAFSYSLLTGLSEPLGAIFAYVILARFMSDALLGIIFGIVAGIMIFISFDELLPSAHEYGEHYIAIYGLIIGMAIMATSLVIFA